VWAAAHHAEALAAAKYSFELVVNSGLLNWRGHAPHETIFLLSA
jgi:hypothetical protein